MTLDGACCARSPIKSSKPVYFELVVRSLEGVTLLKNT